MNLTLVVSVEMGSEKRARFRSVMICVHRRFAMLLRNRLRRTTAEATVALFSLQHTVNGISLAHCDGGEKGFSAWIDSALGASRRSRHWAWRDMTGIVHNGMYFQKYHT